MSDNLNNKDLGAVFDSARTTPQTISHDDIELVVLSAERYEELLTSEKPKHVTPPNPYPAYMRPQ